MQLDTLLQIKEATGQEPQALQRRVDVPPENQDLLLSFKELSLTRKYNEAGKQALQCSEIAQYLTELGISGGEVRSRYFRTMMALDRAYISHHFKQQEARSGDKT